MMLRRQRDARAAANEVDATPADPTPIDAMTKTQLKDALRDRGLAVGGNVDELRDRLTDAVENRQPATDDADEPTEDKALDEVVDVVADAEAETSGGDQDDADEDA